MNGDESGREGTGEERTERLLRIVGSLCARALDLDRDGARSLRELGIGSLRMIELIGDLEATFGLRIADEEIDEENFGTLAGLDRFVRGKSSS